MQYTVLNLQLSFSLYKNSVIWIGGVKNLTADNCAFRTFGSQYGDLETGTSGPDNRTSGHNVHPATVYSSDGVTAANGRAVAESLRSLLCGNLWCRGKQ